MVQISFKKSKTSGVRYSDAQVTKVLDNSYNIKLPNGRIYNNVQNASGSIYVTGDWVAVLFYDDDKIECRIIGKGNKGKSLPVSRTVIV